MIEYNLAGELAALIIIIAILISFMRDYDVKTLSYRCIKYSYYIVLLTVLSSIWSMIYSVPGSGTAYYTISYLSTITYYIFVPSVSVCYLVYAIVVIYLKFSEVNVSRKIAYTCIPYAIYLVILLTNIKNQRIFYISETDGYVRGPWFQLPYLLVAANMLIIMGLVYLNRKMLSHTTIKIMTATFLLVGFAVYLQSINPDTVMTGIINTISILSIHLYIQNVKKSVDSLTGLNNRLALVHSIQSYIKKDVDFSLYIFSLRGFKMINERHNLEFGDKVLMHAANSLSNHFSSESLFRYNGDEFALLLQDNNGQYDEKIKSFHKCYDHSFVIDDSKIFLDIITARVDYRLFGTNVKELISAADYSISVLKRGTDDIKYIYDTSVVKEILQNANMVQELKTALANDTFEVHYQPIYSARRRQFTQAEALVRLRDSSGTLLSPSRFIDLAERTGLIAQMTYVVLEHVCRDLRDLIDTYGSELALDSISVNFPYIQFSLPQMQEDVMEILERHRIDPSMIKIEITERTMISDTAMVDLAMQQMSEKGFVFELDDFGVDYSNLHTFLYLPVNIIKLDRSLVLAAFESHQNMQFIKHIIAGVHATERKIIVEGVEKRDQLKLILESGCQYVQGYFFSKPVPFEAFKMMLSPEKEEELYTTMSELF